MKGVSFNDIHSYTDLGLILAPFTPTPAEPQTNFLKVPGRDGYLDLTEANGGVKYNSREFKFTFTIAPGDYLTFDDRVSEVSNALNGLRCKISLDREPMYYWVGRCVVDKYEQDKNIGRIVVKATVDPYKWWTSSVVSGGKLTSSNRTMTVTAREYPMLIERATCENSDVVINVNGRTYTLEAGENQGLGIYVPKRTVIQVTGIGSVSLYMAKGVL